MPYSIEKPDELPENVQKLPEMMKRQWIEVWNSVYTRCREGNGEDCEGAAFRQANGVIKKAMEKAEMEGFILTELQNAVLETGKPFDGMVAGEFTGMLGQLVVIEAGDFPAYISNTKAAIEHTKTESGELVGLPIDAAGHDKGDGAGWIVDAFAETVTKPGGKAVEVIRLVAKWTELGRGLIEKGIRRMFSPTIDMKNKVIVGGSLTNWPASRDRRGNVLLRPVELEIYTYRGEKSMAVTLSELTTEERAELVKQVAAVISEKPPKPEAVDIAELLDLEGLSEEAKKQRKTELQAHLQAIRKQAELEYRAEMARLKFENDVAEMVQALTGGTEAAPRGYRVASEELRAHLLKLDADEAKFWGGLLSKTQADGFIDFAELGHGRKPKGVTPLPKYYAEKLDAGELKLADLNNPLLAGDLGDMEQYDLSKWRQNK